MAGLADLPVEILTLVLHSLSIDDIRELRAACRRLQAATRGALGRSHLAWLPFPDLAKRKLFREIRHRHKYIQCVFAGAPMDRSRLYPAGFAAGPADGVRLIEWGAPATYRPRRRAPAGAGSRPVRAARLARAAQAAGRWEFAGGPAENSILRNRAVIRLCLLLGVEESNLPFLKWLHAARPLSAADFLGGRLRMRKQLSRAYASGNAELVKWIYDAAGVNVDTLDSDVTSISIPFVARSAGNGAPPVARHIGVDSAEFPAPAGARWHLSLYRAIGGTSSAGRAAVTRWILSEIPHAARARHAATAVLVAAAHNDPEVLGIALDYVEANRVSAPEIAKMTAGLVDSLCGAGNLDVLRTLDARLHLASGGATMSHITVGDIAGRGDVATLRWVLDRFRLGRGVLVGLVGCAAVQIDSPGMLELVYERGGVDARAEAAYVKNAISHSSVGVLEWLCERSGCGVIQRGESADALGTAIRRGNFPLATLVADFHGTALATADLLGIFSDPGLSGPARAWMAARWAELEGARLRERLKALATAAVIGSALVGSVVVMALVFV